MTEAEHRKQMSDARRETARLIIQGKKRISRLYAGTVRAIGGIVREHAGSPDLEARLLAAFTREKARLYHGVTLILREGIVRGTRLVSDIEKRRLLDTLKGVKGIRFDKKALEKMFDAIALENADAASAGIGAGRYMNTGNPNDYPGMAGAGVR
jgi:hypothetical protein